DRDRGEAAALGPHAAEPEREPSRGTARLYGRWQAAARLLEPGRLGRRGPPAPPRPARPGSEWTDAGAKLGVHGPRRLSRAAPAGPPGLAEDRRGGLRVPPAGVASQLPLEPRRAVPG